MLVSKYCFGDYLNLKLHFQVHIIFVPEEELGGMDGMRLFVHTEHFKELNLGFALDEGIGLLISSASIIFGWMEWENLDFALDKGIGHHHHQPSDLHHRHHCDEFQQTPAKIFPFSMERGKPLRCTSHVQVF